jgi:hypothetical protein
MRWFAGLFGWLLAMSVASGEVAWKPSIEIATGPGVRGPWQQNDSRYNYVDDPAVATDERGGTAVAWVDQGRKDVFFQRFGPDGARLGEPVNVSRSPATFSWLPRVVVAPGDPRRVFVLWQEIIFSGGSHGGEILFARSEDGGATFSQPLNLSNSVAGDGKGRISRDVWHNGSLDIAAGPGTLYAAWTEYEGALWFARSGDRGKSFSPLLKINDPKPARAPSLAVGPDGVVYLAWTVGEDGAADIRVAKSTDGGASFSAPRLAQRSKAYSDAPKLAVDPAGTLHLVYGEGDRIRYTGSIDGAKSFASPRDLSRRGAGFPSIAVDAKAGVYVTWELLPDQRHRPRGLGFTVSRDAGRSFSDPALVPDSADPAGGWNGSHQGLLMKKLAVNGDGGIAIVNSSLKDNERSRVWLIRGIRGQSPN